VFFDFRVYKGSVNTEIKEHGIIICRASPLSSSKAPHALRILKSA
jgi:hypothetical protein